MALVAVVAAVLLGGAPQAAAHSELETSNPADGSTVATRPAEIRLTFNDNVLPQYVTVAAQIDGKPAQKLKTQVIRSEVIATPPALDNRAEQAWKVSYRIVSRDGHVVTGAIAFGVRARPTPSPRPRKASPTPASPPPDATASPTSIASPTSTPADVPTPDDPPSERAIVLGAGVLGLVLIVPALLIGWRRRRISDD